MAGSKWNRWCPASEAAPDRDQSDMIITAMCTGSRDEAVNTVAEHWGELTGSSVFRVR